MTVTGKFYVFNPLMNKPQKIYDTYEEALKDAQDIAYKYDRANVYVLEIVAEVQRTELVKTEMFNTAQGKFFEDIQEKIPF